MAHDVLILTPSLPPAPGGGAVYTAILARGLVEHGIARRVVVVTERHPERPDVERAHDGRLVMLRLFPFRAGRAAKDLRSYLDYARQQLALRRLGALVAEHGIRTVLVHASLLHHPGLARWALRRLRRRRVAVVLDVRDPKLPPHVLAEPGAFDAVVCCAERLARELRRRFPAYAARLHEVPIPIEPLRVEAAAVTAALARHGLEHGRYLFNANGLSVEKGLPLLLDAARGLAAAGRAVPLVVAGRERDRPDAVRAALASGALRSLGPLPHAEVLALAKGAAAVVNPSAIETPSRFSIEGLMLGAPSLLPPDVPEFARSCPELVCAGEPRALAEQIAAVLDGRLDGRGRYDVTAHHPEHVLPRYRALLDAAAG
jgi:glycosyltransferase involved in cell wall biosynthesis